MKLAAPLALLLVAGLVACGSSSVAPRTAIRNVIRADAFKKGATHVAVSGIRISKLQPQYAVAQEVYGGPAGPTGGDTWVLRRNGSTWEPTSVENIFPVCSAAPAKVLRELTGSPACYPARGVYTSITWTRGTSVRLRYCLRPGGPGNFLAASKGVACDTAARVVYGILNRCSQVGSCTILGFRCRAYWAGRYGGTFGAYDHALCTNGALRVEWDGG